MVTQLFDVSMKDSWVVNICMQVYMLKRYILCAMLNFRRRASVVVGSKQSAPAASASTNSLTVGPSSVFKQSVMSSSSGQDSDAQPSHNQQQAAEGHEASADAGATASGQILIFLSSTLKILHHTMYCQFPMSRS